MSRVTRVIRDIDVTRPATPTGLAGTAVSQTQINLSWNASTDPQGASSEAVTGVVGYRLYRDGVLRIDQAGLTFNDTTLAAFTSYSYQVSAYDAAGNESVKSTAIVRQTLDTTAPSTPVISATATSSTAITVTLTTASTDSGSGVASYTLQRATDSGFTANLTTTNSLTAGSFPLSVTGLTASTQYFFRLRALDNSSNVGAFSASANATTQASGSATLESDWQARIAGSVWFNDFRADAEVNNFRWTLNRPGFPTGGGNDPLAIGQDAGNIRRITTDGMASGSCLECLNGPTVSNDSTYWWRPFSPMATPGNGKVANDPGGGVSIKTWAPTSQGSQLSNWNQGWYGHETYRAADPTHFDGTDFYVQIVCKMDPRRITGGNEANTVGKFIWLTTAETANSLSNAEHVIWSYGHSGNDGNKNYLRVYSLGVNGIGSFDPLDQEQGTGRIQPGSSSSVDWSWSGGWDVVLIHLRLGLAGVTSGVNSTRLEIWAAHEGETSYTKIWDQEYGNSAYATRNGLQALILGYYNNGNSFPQAFYHRFAQVIFSKNTIPCPQVYPDTLPAWASAQSDSTFTRPFTTSTTLRSVFPVGVPNSNSNGAVAWSSGCAGTYNGSKGYFFMGGGHTDWGDSNVYFANPVTRSWVRLTSLPAAYSGGTSITWADGTPRVPHTYGHVVWTPGFVWLMGQAGPYPSGSTFLTVWRLNLSTLAWTQMQTDWPSGGSDTCESQSHYSPTRGLIYTTSQAGKVWSTNVVTGAMTRINANNAVGTGLGNGSTLIDSCGALLLRGGGNETWQLLNVDNASAGWTTITVSDPNIGSYPGMPWHQTSKKVLCFNPSNRLNVIKVAPPTANPTTFAQLLGTWSVSSSTFTGTTPDTAEATGTHKRWDIIQSMGNSGRDWLFVFSNPDESPNFGKLPAAGL